jgi:hypothetical protein
MGDRMMVEGRIGSMKSLVGIIVARSSAALGLLAVLLWCAPALAQPLGVQDRANAASQMILLGVSQGINSLPPTSGQSFSYEYDPQLDTYVASGKLGPAVFRSPRTIGPGKFSVRGAASFFELYKNLGTIPYRITGFPDEPELFTRLGLEVDAKVGLFNLAAGYGVIEGLEIGLNVPITVVDASAQNIAAFIGDSDVFAAARSIAELDAAILRGDATLRAEPFSSFPNTQFNEGTSVGLGQIGLSTKYALLRYEGFELSPALELLMPSPSEDEFAGPEELSVVPRILTSFQFLSELTGYADLGYNYTVDLQELSGFIWNAGLSATPDPRFVFDVGVGGTYYAEGIEWTPGAFVQPPGAIVDVPLTLQAVGDNTLGQNYVDFLFGLKLQVTESSVLNGAVRVPVNDEGFRPFVAGTLAYEVYF